ncbi:MAG: hypothetical protein QG552_2668 [Thermodesulfobacteriota bacterium]|nr:hypothetical protein [Thermodesulfobacteriota bacterium]
MELDDIRTYCRIVTALKRTINIQREIYALQLDVRKEPLLDRSRTWPRPTPANKIQS